MKFFFYCLLAFSIVPSFGHAGGTCKISIKCYATDSAPLPNVLNVCTFRSRDPYDQNLYAAFNGPGLRKLIFPKTSTNSWDAIRGTIWTKFSNATNASYLIVNEQMVNGFSRYDVELVMTVWSQKYNRCRVTDVSSPGDL